MNRLRALSIALLSTTLSFYVVWQWKLSDVVDRRRLHMQLASASYAEDIRNWSHLQGNGGVLHFLGDAISTFCAMIGLCGD